MATTASTYVWSIELLAVTKVVRMIDVGGGEDLYGVREYGEVLKRVEKVEGVCRVVGLVKERGEVRFVGIEGSLGKWLGVFESCVAA